MNCAIMLIVLSLVVMFAKTQEFDYLNGYYFIFSSQTANHAGAKSACVRMGGHLAIIPDWETENFLRNKGLIYKYRTKNWMTSNNYAYIDAVKTSDG
uniref:C-type lectin domain-containing protein n=1 Tax=Ciona intestinalis TaxID=7719 RepID=H2Y2X1_CIOIN